MSVLALAGAAALALSGCTGSGAGGSSQDASRGTGDSPLRVVVSTTQLADFTGIIGGEDIELRGLLAPGSSAHHFDPTAADLVALSHADVLIINGAGLEEFIDGAIQASGFNGKIIDASTGVDLDLAREITHESQDAIAHQEGENPDAADHSGADHSSADHADDEDDHDHDHGDLNPHLWTSIRFAEGMVSVIAAELAQIDPAHADGYTSRAADYRVKLDALDQWASAQFARVPQSTRLFVSGHDSLGYFLHDYDIEFVGSILKSFEDNAEPSAAEIESLAAEIKRRGVKAIFVESSMNPALARTIARESGATVADADSIYADSLGVEGSGAETYLTATIHNVNAILDAWGAQADPLPKELA